ncbi:MAG: class I SAM-dependent methyltransferase [Thiohalobacteraceae bacterium]
MEQRNYYTASQQRLRGAGAATAPDLKVGRRLVAQLLDGYAGPVAVGLWDGRYARGDTGAVATLWFHSPQALRELVLRSDLVRLSEAYLRGEVEPTGSIEAAFDLVDYLGARVFTLTERMRLGALAMRLPATKTRAELQRDGADRKARENSTESIAYHYDVSNEFYQCWLDPAMVYSCAYFRDAEQSLADAQHDKLDHICRKLRLAPGQRLLDIGCGWGALAEWAARHYGVEVHGITLSTEQYRYAQQRMRNTGLDRQVRIELRDYRDLSADTGYDRISSVGMFEHIGVKNFPLYFQTVKRLMKPGGLFLNHGITNDSGWGTTPVRTFINRYVFPDGELTRVSEVQKSMETEGLEILDVESLRRHYAITLRHWLRGLEMARGRVERLTNTTVYRVWRLYLAGSAHYFERGGLNVYQILAGHLGAVQPVPLRRDDLYR